MNQPQGIEDVTRIIGEITTYLSETFPVCCKSDEFYYFPQVLPDICSSPGWDDFSPEKVDDAALHLSSWEKELTDLSLPHDLCAYIDRNLWTRVVKTLKEDLLWARPHRRQPTFHLTIAATGIADALAWKPPGSLDILMESLPSFLTRAKRSLVEMPDIFRQMGISMTGEIMRWILSLEIPGEGSLRALTALEDFEGFLIGAATVEEFRHPPDLYEVILENHIGSPLKVKDLTSLLEEERDSNKKIMEKELLKGGKVHIGRNRNISLVSYREEVESITSHLCSKGIISPEFVREHPLSIESVPRYLLPIRAASAYSSVPMKTGNRGTFFIMPNIPGEGLGKVEGEEMRMLTAHETYPGHHLLDSYRFESIRPLRRPIEFPLYYEGWASFAESLLAHTGYFYSNLDRALLARRRHRRAVRGLVDLQVEMGEISLEEGASLLVETGLEKEDALKATRKYMLRPGYQLCYTLGLIEFIELFRKFRTLGAGGFTRAVLTEGEVGFHQLEVLLERTKGGGTV